MRKVRREPQLKICLPSNESDVRWTHSQLQAFVQNIGIQALLPVIFVAFVASGYQAILANFSVVSVIVSGGLFILFFITCIHAGPAMRDVRDTSAYEADLDSVSSALFRMVRLHHVMFIAVVPLTLAQLFLLFV